MIAALTIAALTLTAPAAAPLEHKTTITLAIANVGTTVTGRLDGKPVFVTQGYHFPTDPTGKKRPVLQAVTLDGKTLWQHKAPPEVTVVGEYIQWIDAPDIPEPLILWAAFPPAKGGEGLDNRGGLLRARDGKQIHRFQKGSNNPSIPADLDRDGKTELLYCGQQFVACLDLATRTPRWTHTDAVLFCWSHPAVADITGNGKSEIIWGSEYNLPDGKTSTLIAVDHNDKTLWRVDTINEDLGSTPVFVVDVNGDATPELVKNGLDLCGKNNLPANHLYVFTAKGKLLRKIPSHMYSTGIADLDRDNTVEAFGLISRRDGGRLAKKLSHLRCVNLHTGKLVWQIPAPRVGLPAANALAADLTGNRKLEAILADGNPSFYGRLPDPLWGAVYVVSHDGKRLQTLNLPTWPRRLAMCDIDDDNKNELIVQLEGNPAKLAIYNTIAPATTKTWPLPFGNKINHASEHTPTKRGSPVQE